MQINQPIKKAQILAYFRIRNRIPNWIPILTGSKGLFLAILNTIKLTEEV